MDLPRLDAASILKMRVHESMTLFAQATSPDGTLLAAGGSLGAIYVWPLSAAACSSYSLAATTDKKRSSPPFATIPDAHSGTIYSMVTDNNYDMLITCGGTTLCGWRWSDLTSAVTQCQTTANGEEEEGASLGMAASIGAAAAADVAVEPAWCVQCVAGEGGFVAETNSLAVAEGGGGPRLFSAASDGIVYAWDLEAGSAPICTSRIAAHKGCIHGIDVDSTR